MRAVDRRASVLAQNPVRLNEYSEPQPDLALLLRRDDFYRERHPRAEDVLLIIEVAATSLPSTERGSCLSTHAMESRKCGSWTLAAGGSSATALRSRVVYSRRRARSRHPLEVAALAGVAVDLHRLYG